MTVMVFLEKKTMLTLLNTSILTTWGEFAYYPCLLCDAQEAAQEAAAAGQLVSAIGHQSTADMFTVLLGVPVPVNRIEYRQQPDERALVFKLRGRPPEGGILTEEEIERIGYDFGFLVRRA